MKHIAIIRFWYEGNSFSPIVADIDFFRKREWLSGADALAYYRNTNIELGAVEKFVDSTPDIMAHYIFCAAAYPAGPIASGLFPEMLEKIEQGLSPRDWDGVYVSLHGSSVVEDEAQPELTMLKKIRVLVGDVPIATTFDLHANINPAICDIVNIIVGYKTYPHVDMLETGAKALSLLAQTMVGAITPRPIIVPAGFTPTSFNMRTEKGPMADMMAAARFVERNNGFYDVSVFGSFIYADTPDTCASITICAELGDENSLFEAKLLSMSFKNKASELEVKLPAPSLVFEDLKAQLENKELTGPVAVIEPSDNVFSGGGADTPGLLHALKNADFDVPILFAFFWDSDLVSQAQHAGIGGEIDCFIGGKLSAAFGAPVEAYVKVMALTNGKFVNDGPMEKNLAVDLGATALLGDGNIQIIVTSNVVPVNDAAYFRLHGIDLADFSVVCVKAKNHFRATFGSYFDQIIEVETAGPASSDIKSFSFKHISSDLLFLDSRIRKATIDDVDTIAGLHSKSWRDVYKGILPDRYLKDEIAGERQEYWHKKLSHLPDEECVLLFEKEGKACGFIWLSRTGEAEYDGVIEVLHIDKKYKGQGIAKRLMAEVGCQLRFSGGTSICLRVFTQNSAAIGFYEHIGGIADQEGIDTFADANAPDIRIGWNNLDDFLKHLCC